MTHRKTFASMRGTLEADVVRLGERAQEDADGVQLLHDVRATLHVVTLADEAGEPIGPESFAALIDDVSSVHERVTDYVTGRAAIRASLSHIDPDSPTPSEIDQIVDAVVGPRESPTLVPCPRCLACAMCQGTGLTTAIEAARFSCAPSCVACSQKVTA